MEWGTAFPHPRRTGEGREAGGETKGLKSSPQQVGVGSSQGTARLFLWIGGPPWLAEHLTLQHTLCCHELRVLARRLLAGMWDLRAGGEGTRPDRPHLLGHPSPKAPLHSSPLALVLQEAAWGPATRMPHCEPNVSTIYFLFLRFSFFSKRRRMHTSGEQVG